MATVTFKGGAVSTCGQLPEPGDNAPDCTLVKTDLSELTFSELKGRRVVLNIFPSLDTPVCAASVRRFNTAAAGLDNTTVLCISMDLPFAQARYCGAEGLNDVVPLSAFRNSAFGNQYGVRITDGPLAGLFARAVVVVGADGNVVYSQLAPEITEEPDYDAALSALQ
jgi:thioredoxin-dependent peroxiredoxin